MKNVTALTYLTLTGIAMLVGGCALDGGGGERGFTSCEASSAGIAAFAASGLHAELQVNCASCHSVAHSTAPSTFADTSAGLSYSYAKRWSDFSSPSSSFFVERMRQGHNCGSKCATLIDNFTREIGVWAAAEAGLPASTCGDGAGVVRTVAVPVPATLGLNQSANLKFDLSLATPPIANAVFQITVTRKSLAVGADPGAFLLEKPMFAAGPRAGDTTANIRVSKVNLITDRNSDQYRVWSGLNYVVAPKTFDASQPLALVPCSPLSQLGTWGDTATIALELGVEATKDKATIPGVNPYLCKAQANFDANVITILRATHLKAGNPTPVACTSCHRLGSNNFALDAAGISNCETVKARSNPSTPASSLILTYPQGATHSGGRFTFSAGEIAAITNWVNAER